MMHGHRRPNKGEDKHKFKDTWGKLLSYCKPYIVFMVVAIIFAICSTVFKIIGPGYIGDITDAIQEGLVGMKDIDMKLVSSIGIFLAIIFSLSLLLGYFQAFIMATITASLSKKLRNDISKKINRIPLSYFDKTSKGDILSRVTNDVDTIGMTMNQSLASLVSAVIMFVGSIIAMFMTNYIMAIAAIVSSLVGFILMFAIIFRSQKYFTLRQEQLGLINGHIEEVYSGHNVIKVYNAKEKFEKKFNKLNRDLYNSNWKSQSFGGLMMPLMGFVGNFGYVIVCIVGGLLVIDNKISFGVIASFMLYVRLFINPLSTFAQAMQSLQQTSAASFRVFEFLDLEEVPSEKEELIELKEVKGDIEFKNVQFGYNDDKIIINDFSAKANSGNKIAIVGPTGAGKTTMVNLLMRFYEVNSGDILIDNTSITDISRENLRNLFCMVLQDTWLFEGTIKENIIYSKKGVTDEDVIKAAKACGIHHFIKTLPKGYDTVLNDDASVSAGQKQLMTIARAMIENAPMLILDEATSNVDTRTEILIQDAMDKLTKGRTSIIIAHRLSTIKNADLILVMKNGDVIESGNHNDLIEQNGFYADLYNSQFEN